MEKIGALDSMTTVKFVRMCGLCPCSDQNVSVFKEQNPDKKEAAGCLMILTLELKLLCRGHVLALLCQTRSSCLVLFLSSDVSAVDGKKDVPLGS